MKRNSTMATMFFIVVFHNNKKNKNQRKNEKRKNKNQPYQKCEKLNFVILKMNVRETGATLCADTTQPKCDAYFMYVRVYCDMRCAGFGQAIHMHERPWAMIKEKNETTKLLEHHLPIRTFLYLQ